MLKTFFISLLSVIVGGVITYIINTYYVDDVVAHSFSFGKYLDISGEYKITFPENPDRPYEKAYLKQTGSRVTGTIDIPDTNSKYQLVGHVTASRLFTWQYKPNNPFLNDYGSGLVQLAQDGNSANGYVLIISDKQEVPVPVKIYVEPLVE